MPTYAELSLMSSPSVSPTLAFGFFASSGNTDRVAARIKAIQTPDGFGEHLVIETNAGEPALPDKTTQRLCIDQSGIIAVDGELRLNGGLSVGEFSGDATLGANNDQVVPTQKAVRAYIEGRVGSLNHDLAAHSGRIDQLEQRVAAKAALGGSPAQDFQARNLTISGVTTLNGGLRVAANQATALGGTLVVSGATTLSSLTIGSGNLSVVGDVRINDKNIWFRGGNDPYHGLGFHGTGKEFAGQNINGPVLYGNNGGGLGARVGDRPEQQVLAVRWTGAGNVGIGTPNPQNTLQLGGNLHMDGHSIFLRSGPGDRFDVIKWNSSVDRVDIGGYAGVNLGYTSQKPDAVTPVLTIETNGNVGVTGTIIQEGWHDLPLQNGWQVYGLPWTIHPGYFRDKNGIVHLHGLIKGGAIGYVNGQEVGLIAVLPDGYRPEYRELFTVMTGLDNVGRCDVDTDGKIYARKGNNAWFSLDGITFRARSF